MLENTHVHRRHCFHQMNAYIKLKIINNLRKMMTGLMISGRFLIKRFQNEHVFTWAFDSLLLPILIGFKSFYLLSTPCRIILLELHSLTTYIFASKLFKMQFLNSCVENVTQLLAINQVKKVFGKYFLGATSVKFLYLLHACSNIKSNTHVSNYWHFLPNYWYIKVLKWGDVDIIIIDGFSQKKVNGCRTFLRERLCSLLWRASKRIWQGAIGWFLTCTSDGSSHN